jgi:hypothetical protein
MIEPSGPAPFAIAITFWVSSSRSEIVAEIPAKNTILRQRLQTPVALQVVQVVQRR